MDVVPQPVEDGCVCGRVGGAGGIVDALCDEEHGVNVAGARTHVEHGVEVNRVGFQAAVLQEDVVVLEGFGDGEFGMAGFGAATEDARIGLYIGELSALLHLF